MVWKGRLSCELIESSHCPAVIMQTPTKSVTYIRLHLKINWFTNYGNDMRQSRAKRLGSTLITQTTVTLRSQYIQSTLCSGFSIPFHQLVAWKFKIGMFWAFYARSETETHRKFGQESNEQRTGKIETERIEL